MQCAVTANRRCGEQRSQRNGRIETIKQRIKTCVAFAFQLLTLPLYLWWLLTGRRAGGFVGISQMLCLFLGGVGNHVRAGRLRWAAKCGENASLQIGVIFGDPRVEIGHNVYIGPFSNIDRAKIEDEVLIGSGVHVTSGSRVHSFDRVDIPIRQQAGQPRRVTPGRGCWIGNGAILMADVGEECVIGAGAVVTEAIPAWSIAVGVPARVTGARRDRADEPTKNSDL